MASLISLPLRLGVRSARASLQATRDLADLGLATLELVGRMLGEEPPGAAEEHDLEVEIEVERLSHQVDLDLERRPDGEARGPAARPAPKPRPAPRPRKPRPVPPPAPVPPVTPSAAGSVTPPAPVVPPPPPSPSAGARGPLSAVDDTAADIGLEPETHSPDERELVEEFADAGAQDGAGATLRIAPPFDGYDELRAPDVIARLAGADAAELGETELYERSHRARRTVLDAVARELRRRTRS